MANPQIEDGHVKLANELIEALAKMNLRPYEWRVLMLVLRKTYGYNKKLDYISVSQIAQGTGLHKQHASRAKLTLIAKRLLIERNGQIGPNKNYDQWHPIGRRVTGIGDGVTDLGDEKVTDLGETVTGIGDTTSPKQAPQKTERQPKDSSISTSFCAAFRDYWNSKSNLPPVRAMGAKRRTKLKTRMREPDFAKNWRQIIDRIAASSFCTGGGRGGWRADVDWVLWNSENYLKVLEGKYDDAASLEPLERGPDGLTPRQRELKRLGATQNGV